jgi:hypothetical protein
VWPATLLVGTSAGCAKTQLDELTVAKAGSMKGFSRAKFPHWRSTGNNCDVRDSVLKRDGTKVKLSGCNVVAGTWKSIYDGKTLTSPTQVDIDHLVPLANAWRSGASAWTEMSLHAPRLSAAARRTTVHLGVRGGTAPA